MREGSRYLTVAEFAKSTGLSEKTVRRRVGDQTLAHHQPGGKKTRILIPVDALDRKPLTGLPASSGQPNSVIRSPESLPEPQRPSLPGPKPRWR